MFKIIKNYLYFFFFNNIHLFYKISNLTGNKISKLPENIGDCTSLENM